MSLAPKGWTVVAGGLLFAVVESGCTFITACPNGTGGNNNTAGAGGGNETDGGNAGSTGTAGGAPIPTGAWTNVTSNLAGLASECGNMAGMSAKADEDLLIAGIAQLGLWSSTDGGQTWTQMGAGAGSDVITNRLTSIVYDPMTSQHWYESGIYNNVGVYETKDDGVTFKALGTIMTNGTCDGVGVDFTDPDRKTLVAGGHEAAQTLRSTQDGGATWASIGASLPDATNCTLPLVIDAQTYLVGCGGYGGGPSGMYRTTDGGMTWSLATATGGASAALQASDGSIYSVSPNGVGITRSTDSGVTWTDVWKDVANTGFVAGPSLRELPDGRLVTIGKHYVMISSDMGASWVPVSSALPYSDALGVVYSAQQKAFFVWHQTCGFSGPVPVPTDAIMRYDFDYTTG